MVQTIAIRRASNDADLAFFMSIALKSSYALFSPNRFIPWAVYRQEHRKVLERLFSRQRSMLVMACDEQEPNFIFGCALGDPSANQLDYAYVKKSLRGFGLFGKMLVGLGIDLTSATFSHWTRDMAHVMKTRPGTWAYNPYLQFPTDGEPQ